MKRFLLFLTTLAFSTFSCHLDRLTDTGENCLNPPTASFSIEGGGTDCKAPCTVKFINSSTNATGYKLKFGDGDSTSFTTGDISHTYQNAGFYSASLIAIGDAGCQASSMTKQITILPTENAPLAGFTVDLSDNDGFAPITIKFTNVSINATSFQWDFGDGSVISNEISPSHKYITSGNYTVKLTAVGIGSPDIESRSFQLNARTFITAIGGSASDLGVSGRQTDDDGYILFGSTESWGQGKSDLLLAKLEKDGNLSWHKEFGTNSNEIAIAFDKAWYNYVILGFDESSLQYPYFIITSDNSGNQIKYDPIYSEIDFINSLQAFPVTDGTSLYEGCLVVGSTKTLIPNVKFIIKVVGSGIGYEEHTYGNDSDAERGRSIIPTKDLGYMILALKTNSNSDDLYLIKLKGNGEKSWDKTIEGFGYEIGRAIKQTSDEGYIIVGRTENDIYIVKIDAYGSLTWQKRIDKGGIEDGFDIQETSDGGFIVLGSTDNGTLGGQDVLLQKIDAQGNELWEKYFGWNGNEKCYSIQITSDKGYLLTGFTDSFGPLRGNDLLLIKTDKDGNVH